MIRFEYTGRPLICTFKSHCVSAQLKFYQIPHLISALKAYETKTKTDRLTPLHPRNSSDDLVALYDKNEFYQSLQPNRREDPFCIFRDSGLQCWMASLE